MITADLSITHKTGDYEALKPIITKQINNQIGGNVRVILPVKDLKIRGTAIKHKDHEYGLAYDEVGFIPFTYTISMVQLKLNMEDIKVESGQALQFTFDLDTSGNCTFLIEKQGNKILACNMMDAPVQDVINLRESIKSKHKTVTVNVKQQNEILTTILSSLFITVVVFVAWTIIMGLGAATYDSVNNGGTVFFILIPLGLLYGVFAGTAAETIILYAPVAIAFLLGLWTGYDTKKKSNVFIASFKNGSQPLTH